ncbi:MAG: carboxypeptidase regulatory-like domain-containing protein, partial [Flavobacteriaceae bacterium]|nr:carboxypeptidase regulatory-like domain-containing protein [Flavobacteriaceae bacterium]
MKNFLLIFLLACTQVMAQGLTSSSVGGRVLDDQSEALIGSTIVVTHQPTGSVYGATTDFDGYYRVSGLRPGGPYTVEISYVGFNQYVQEDLYLQLGVSEQINTSLTSSMSELDEVVVSASQFSNKTGAENTINRRMIDALPQASRSIADFVRVSPFAQISEGSDGFSVSLAGMNNRYNAIYIDGAVNNDVFGLAGSGTNGGQTGVNPFSVDAIESFQVQVAPYDVKVGGFAGGTINAVSRSGTNEFEASSYYFYRNQNLAGKTPSILTGEGEEREKLPDFNAQTYGIRLGGALIENELFYFINYERQEDETPAPFNMSNYSGYSTAADLANLANFVSSNYGYDVGVYDDNPTVLNSDKITLKLDWNADEK